MVALLLRQPLRACARARLPPVAAGVALGPLANIPLLPRSRLTDGAPTTGRAAAAAHARLERASSLGTARTLSTALSGGAPWDCAALARAPSLAGRRDLSVSLRAGSIMRAASMVQRGFLAAAEEALPAGAANAWGERTPAAAEAGGAGPAAAEGPLLVRAAAAAAPAPPACADAPSWISYVIAATFCTQALLIGTVLSCAPLLLAREMGLGVLHVGLAFARESGSSARWGSAFCSAPHARLRAADGAAPRAPTAQLGACLRCPRPRRPASRCRRGLHPCIHQNAHSLARPPTPFPAHSRRGARRLVPRGRHAARLPRRAEPAPSDAAQHARRARRHGLGRGRVSPDPRRRGGAGRDRGAHGAQRCRDQPERRGAGQHAAGQVSARGQRPRARARTPRRSAAPRAGGGLACAGAL